MTKEEKIELRREVCARMLYGLKALATHSNQVVDILRGGCYDGEKYYFIPSILGLAFEIEDFKIYLRPMSSMTEEEKKILKLSYDLDYIDTTTIDFGEYCCEGSPVPIKKIVGIINWLNANHFDYRGLIEKGLALEAPEEMYKS